jgi:hypothetical protein
LSGAVASVVFVGYRIKRIADANAQEDARQKLQAKQERELQAQKELKRQYDAAVAVGQRLERHRQAQQRNEQQQKETQKQNAEWIAKEQQKNKDWYEQVSRQAIIKAQQAAAQQSPNPTSVVVAFLALSVNFLQLTSG